MQGTHTITLLAAVTAALVMAVAVGLGDRARRGALMSGEESAVLIFGVAALALDTLIVWLLRG